MTALVEMKCHLKDSVWSTGMCIGGRLTTGAAQISDLKKVEDIIDGMDVFRFQTNYLHLTFSVLKDSELLFFVQQVEYLWWQMAGERKKTRKEERKRESKEERKSKQSN